MLYHHGVPSFFTVSCRLMLHRQCCVTMAFPLYSVIPLDVTQTCVASPWYSLTLYSVMLLDVTQTCITMVFPFSLPCHAIGCYTDMYCITMVFPHSLQCHAIGCYTNSVVSPWYPLFLFIVMLLDVTQTCVVSPWYSLFLYSVMLLDVIHKVLYHMFPLSLQCHAVGCYADMCCITMVFSLSFQWLFLPDPTIRSKLTLPPRAQVDYRAACFCHRQLIDIGYVCSVCLSSVFIINND